jgi:hypothetical protein
VLNSAALATTVAPLWPFDLNLHPCCSTSTSMMVFHVSWSHVPLQPVAFKLEPSRTDKLSVESGIKARFERHFTPSYSVCSMDDIARPSERARSGKGPGKRCGASLSTEFLAQVGMALCIALPVCAAGCRPHCHHCRRPCSSVTMLSGTALWPDRCASS